MKRCADRGSQAAIAALKAGDVRTVMITGDNWSTGFFIAQECGLLPTTATALLADCASPDGPVDWTVLAGPPRPKLSTTAAVAAECADPAGQVEIIISGPVGRLLRCYTTELKR